jgi:hypothetical protein
LFSVVSSSQGQGPSKDAADCECLTAAKEFQTYLFPRLLYNTVITCSSEQGRNVYIPNSDYLFHVTLFHVRLKIETIYGTGVQTMISKRSGSDMT